MRWDVSPPSLSCALRSSDAASTRAAAVRADGEGGKREGALYFSQSLSLSSPAHAPASVLSFKPRPLRALTVRSRQRKATPLLPRFKDMGID